MKKIIRSSILVICMLLIFFSCRKEKSTSLDTQTRELNEKFSSANIKINPPSYQKIVIDSGIYVEIIDVNVPIKKLLKGENLIEGTILTVSGKKYYNIIQFTSEKKITKQELIGVLINSYKHSLHITNLNDTKANGILTYFKLSGELFYSEHIVDGKFNSPVTLGNLEGIKFLSSTQIIDKSRNQRLMSTDAGCIDWYYVETWYNGEGQVVSVKESFLFQQCPEDGPGSFKEYLEVNSNGKLVCPNTFQFNNTGSNWQAAYVKNYKYAFMGTDKVGEPANYFINMNFEIGVGRSLVTQQDAQRYATRALNIAEAKVAQKISSGHYSGQGAKAPLSLKRDLINEMRVYFNRQLGLVDNSTATTVNQGRVTALEVNGVDAVFVGFFGC